MRPSTAFSVKTAPARRRAAGWLATAAAAVALAACATAPAYQPTAPRFEGPPVWRVAANQIEVQVAPDVKPPAAPVAARLAATPVEIARAWPASRLRADPGAGGAVVYTIERAEATERFLEPAKGVTELFVKNPEAEFTVAFAVNIAHFDASGTKRGSVRAESRIVGTMKEGADEDDRRRLWERLLKDAAGRLDAELQKQVPSGLPGAGQVR